MSITTPKKIGRYQILNHLESGGMGSVYLARDPAIDRLVAIKLLREGFDSAELRARFLREARSAGRLQHVNIVTIFDVGEHQKRPFIAMEYLEGETLQEVIRRRALLTVGRKLQLMDELCAGLQYAHAGGIVHRDIKPSNVMLAGDGVLKVLDFGIARINDASGASSYTQAGALMGTLNYMAPEQMIGLPDVDARADMFSAGAVFYELLTYKQAFPGGLDSGIMHKIIDASPEPAEKVDPTLDPDLIAIVNRCLEKSRDNRFPDMAAVRRDLALLRRRYDEQPPPEQKTTRRDLDRLRTTQIRSHLEDARKALGGGDFTAALEASQRALLLNGDDRDALECEQRARTGLEERQIHEWLTSARTQINLGAVTSASLLVDRALSLNSASPEAVAVRALVDEARQRLAETRERARALEAALTGARADLSAGAFDTASARLDEALAIEPENAEAKAIRLELRSAIEARRIAEEETRARTAINTAREQFAAGNHAGSIAELERFQPAALVAPALDELRDELHELERRRIEAERQAEERRKTAEAADRLRQATAGKLDDAAARLAAQDLDAARALTREVLAEQPDHNDARALDLKIDQAIDQRRLLAEAEARRRAEEEARARTTVNTAHEQFATGDHAGAIAALERFEPAALVAEALDELRVELREIERLRIEAERQAAERRKAVEAAERLRKATARKLDDAAARFEAQDLDAARALTREVLADQPQHSDARALDAEIDRAIERRRQVADGLASARAHIDAGRFDDARLAIAGIEKLDASVPDLVNLRRAADTGIRAANAALKRRRESEERLTAAKRAFASRGLVEALEQVDSALKIDPSNADAKTLETKIRTAIQQQRDDEQRRRDEIEKRAAEARVKEKPAVTSQTEGQIDETVLVHVTPPSDEPLVLTPSSPVGPLLVTPSGGVSLPVPAFPPVPREPVGGPAVEDETLVTADTPAPANTLKYAAIGSGTLAVAALIVWLATRPAPPPPPPPPAIPGTVVLDIAPWATIEAITSKADGAPTPSDCRETPCVLSLPAGEYHVRASNPNFPGTLEFDVAIESGGVREEHRSVPGFRPEDEVSKILDGKN